MIPKSRQRKASRIVGPDGRFERIARGSGFIGVLALFALCFFLLACPRPPAPVPEAVVPPVEPAAPASVVPPPAPDPRSLPCLTVVRIEVRKRARVLEATCAEGGLRVHPIALSREPVGAKTRRGDQRMPEGDYHLVGPPRASRFHRFVPIDYPSLADADRALVEKQIPLAVHRAIAAAHRAGRLPPQDTALGGLVGFHGEGARWRGDLDLDWTEGCIALPDEGIDWLATHARPGTPVSIRP